MSEIKKYMKAMRFKANPRYLTRDFIVPLYTGTEPDIVPEASVEQLGTVQEFNDGGRVGFKDGSKPARSTIYKITRANHPQQGKYAYHGFNIPIKYFDTKKEAEDFKKFRLQNKAEQQTIKITDDFIQEVEKRIKAGKNKVQIATELKVPFKRINKAIEQGNIKITGSVTQNPEYRSFVKKNYKDKTIETIAKELFTDKKIPLSTKKSRVNTIVSSLIADKELEPVAASSKSEIRDRYGFGKSSKYEIDKATRERRDSLISKISEPSTEYQIRQLKMGEGPQLAHRLGLEESAKLKQQYDIGNLGIDAPKINQEIVKSFENLRDKLVIERDAIAKKIEKNPSLELKKQLLNVNEKIKQVVDASDGRIQAFVLDEQTLEPIKYLGIKPRELAYGVIDETAKDFDLKEINKIIRDANKTGTTTPENWEKIKKYQMFVANLENEVGMAKKEKVTDVTKNLKDNLTDYLNNNPDEVKVLKSIGIPCRRSVGGKVDTECLAENVVKEIKKLEDGTDLQKASVLNKLNNAVKLGSGLAEEVIGFGKGAAGRTLGPLVALNSALEQWTSGDIKEGFRKIADVLDPTTLVGDPLGFAKMRMEGTQEDIKKIIGEKNYKGFENIKSAADEYNQYLDVKKKLERAKSAAEGAYDPLSPGVDSVYLTDLEKQKSILQKNITGTKYKDVQDNLINYGKNIYENILNQNPNAPESSKYVYKKAAIEKLGGAFGNDIIEMFKDEINAGFGPDLNITDIQQKNMKPLSEEQQNVIESSGAIGAAEGGRIGLSGGGGPKMGRRGFLGLLTGIAAAPELIKSIKGTKKAAQVAKVLPKVSGMPEWFPSLIAKIEKEGKYPAKDTGLGDNLKIKELTIPSQIGKGGDEIFTMIEYPDGKIEIQANMKGGAFDSPFELHYTPPKSDIDVTTGKVIKEPGEFSVVEQRPRPVGWEGSDLEIDYENMSIKDAISDLEKIEKIATGKILDPKIANERSAARKIVHERPYEDVINRYPDPDTGGDWWER